MQLLKQPANIQIMTRVADDAETLRSVRGSRAGTDVESVSGSSINTALRDRVFGFDQTVADSPASRRVQQQRVVPQLSLQTQFQPGTPRLSRSPLTDEGYVSGHTEGPSLSVPKFGAPQRPRGFSMPDNNSTPILPGHSRSVSYNQRPSRPSPSISRQWQSDSQVLPQKPRSPGEKLSALFSSSRDKLKALTQSSSPSSATSPTMSRGRRTIEGDSSPSINLTTLDAALVPPIVKAAQAGSREEVERLIEQGCDVDRRHIQSGRTALLVAAHCGYDATVELLIRKNANLAIRDEWGATALHLAAERGNCTVIELLMIESALLEVTNAEGETAVRVAADWGQIDAMQVLLRHNAKVNTRANRRMTPLHSAAQRGDAQITQLLLSNGADVEAKDGTIMTALHYASEMGHVEVIKILLERRAQIESAGPEKRTPLICAAAAGQIQAVELLLKKKAAIRAVDEAGMTALHWAACRGHEEIVKIFSKKKVSLFCENKAGQTPLHLAAGCSQFGVVDFLLRKHVPINSRCNMGLTALHYACDIKDDGDSVEIATVLLQAGAEIEIFSSEDQQTPLHIAAGRSSPDLVDMLCDQGASIDARDSLDDRPLCVASRYGQVETVRKLLERGSPLYTRGTKGIEDSPLCLAARGGHSAVVSLLLERGASTLRKDDRGWLPFHYAAHYGHLDVLQLLLCYGNIPEADAPEILAMPEAIGFALDADISDEQKFQVQAVLDQAFEHLGILRNFTEMSRPQLPTSPTPTEGNFGTHPAYRRTSLSSQYSRGARAAVQRNKTHRELPASLLPTELPTDFNTGSRERRNQQSLGPSVPSRVPTAGHVCTSTREVSQGHDSGNATRADQTSGVLSDNNTKNQSTTWPWPKVVVQSEEPPECATWPRLASPLQLPSFMETESSTWRGSQNRTQSREEDAGTSTWSPLNTLSSQSQSVGSAISPNWTVSPMSTIIGETNKNDERSDQPASSSADTSTQHPSPSHRARTGGVITGRATTNPPFVPPYPMSTPILEINETENEEDQPASRSTSPPAQQLPLSIREEPREVAERRDDTSSDQKPSPPTAVHSPSNTDNAAVPVNFPNRIVRFSDTASSSESLTPRLLPPLQRSTSPLLANNYFQSNWSSDSDSVYSTHTEGEMNSTDSDSSLSLYVPVNVRSGLHELQGCQ